MRMSYWSSDVCSSDLFRHHTDLPVEARGAVVALGNFDGVHRGHKAVIAEAGRLARAAGVPHGVITFEPHPRRLFRPDDPPFRLSTLRTKTHWIAATGADLLFVLQFDRALAQKDPAAFAEAVLSGGLRSEEHTSELQSLMRISYAV